MMIKYCVYSSSIDRIEVDRETEYSVWIKEARYEKSSNYATFYDSWNEAHEALLSRAQRGLDAARRNLEQAQADYGNVKGLKE